MLIQNLMKINRKCCKKVEILDEIDNYITDHQKTAVIVIDFKNLILHFLKNHHNRKDQAHGGRLNLIRFRFESFLLELRDHQCDIIFVYQKTTTSDFLPDKKWDSKEKFYEDDLEILRGIDKSDGDWKKVPENFPNLRSESVTSALAQVASKYGKFQRISVDKDHKDVVYFSQIANRADAMAVLGQDWELLFVPGSWKLWSIEDLRFDNMTVQEFNKNIIVKTLGLTYEEMPIFDALTTRRFSNYADQQILRFFLKSRNGNLHQKVSQYLMKLTRPMQVFKIVQEIFNGTGNNLQQITDKIERYVELYDIRSIRENPQDESSNDFNSFLFEILGNQPIEIPTPYLDDFPKDDVNYFKLVNPIVQKVAGMIMKLKKLDGTRKLEIKMSHEDSICFVDIEPVHPTFEVPLNLLEKDLITNVGGILEWILQWKLKIPIENLPCQQLCDILVLIYLHQNRWITGFEIVTIFKTLLRVGRENEPGRKLFQPKMISGRGLRVSQLFLQFKTVFVACLTSIGLKYLTSDITFDGIFFQSKFEKKGESKKFNILTGDELVRKMIHMITESSK